MKRMLLICCSLTLMVVLHAQIIHVPADYPTIQQGINAANPGDTVLVAEGTYYENINFLGKKPLILASEFLLDSDTTHISNTIINGSQPVNPDIGSVVTFESGEDTTSVLCGFTITGGTGTMEPSEDMRMGGGIHIKYAGGKLLNNYVHDNTVTHTGAILGGGMQLGGPVSVIPWLVLRANRIYNNHAISTSDFVGGGGVICYYNLIMENNDISYNEINGHKFVGGGGMVCYGEFGPVELRISHNTFTHNKAITDQGAFGTAGQGGGIEFDENCWGTINNNIISFNTIQAPDLLHSYGPGVYVQYNKDGLVFGNNIIEENSTTSQNSWGGGLSLLQSGGVYQNNVIRNNTAHNGGGVSILWSDNAKAIFTNNTITGNESFSGGGINMYVSDAVVINSIIWNNTATEGASIYSYGSTLKVRYSDVEGTGAWEGEGNVLCVPQFLADGYHLDYTCMLLNKGISSIEIDGITYNCPMYDIDGDPRPYAGEAPEIGADELRTAAGTEEYRTANLTIFPNPASNKVTIESDRASSIQGCILYVSNVDGKELMQQLVTGFYTEIDISSLSAGVYFIKIISRDQSVPTTISKFIKK